MQLKFHPLCNPVKALLLATVMGLLGALLQIIPLISNLESDIGLEWLFHLRGPRPTPEEVVIITIDRESSTQLGLPNLPRKWPRNLHATLIDKLSDAGAQVTGLDIIFNEKHSTLEDHALAFSFKNADNIILFEYLEAENSKEMHREKRLPPIAEFQQSALAVAPFILPKVPEKIKQAFLYREGAGGFPTLPVVALDKFMQPWQKDFYALFKQVIQENSPNSKLFSTAKTNPLEFAAQIRSLLLAKPALIHKLEEKIARLPIPLTRTRLSAWLFALKAPNGIYLDYYGPPRSITTIPYHKALSAPRDWLKEKLSGKAIFIGFSERLQPEQKDGFYTVFTDSEGLDISGVEIMATTFANLLEQRTVRPLSIWTRLGITFLFGFVTGLVFYLSRGWLTLVLALTILTAWLSGSLWLFTHYALWLPLTTPLLFVLPVALVLSLLLHFINSHQHRLQLDKSFRRFVPGHVVDAVGSNTLISTPQPIFACCLGTDIKAYTNYSEQLPPAKLHLQMDKYYKLIFPPVHDSEGLIMDAVGDSMLAIWQKKEPQTLKQDACMASLKILQLLEDAADKSLETRMGLHCGEISIGAIGDDRRKEYRAMGDVINSTTRIEGLNKRLGTKLLASSEILEGCEAIQSRHLGKFLLKGKQQAIPLHEILGFTAMLPAEKIKLKDQFETAIQLFSRGELLQASTVFQSLGEHYQDGPAKFYHRHCIELMKNPLPVDWQGIVVINEK